MSAIKVEICDGGVTVHFSNSDTIAWGTPYANIYRLKAEFMEHMSHAFDVAISEQLEAAMRLMRLSEGGT